MPGSRGSLERGTTKFVQHSLIKKGKNLMVRINLFNKWKNILIVLIMIGTALLFQGCKMNNGNENKDKDEDRRPNIIIAMSDNQSYPHTGAYGDKSVNTPGFDYVAEKGILFHNAFSSSPGCAPSRASIVTGRYPWQNEEAGGHQTLYPAKYIPFPDVLEASGYHIGYTGKGVAPFNWRQGGRDRDPAGPEYNDVRYEWADSIEIPDEDIPDPEAFASDISTVNYSENFRDFISKKADNEPFFFWYGSREPHTPFEEGAGLRSGKKPEDVKVPGFLPDHEAIRKDLLDYAYEIDWFDSHLMEMIEILKEMGELENTIIIVTSDNGMQFPYAIANSYEYGIHVPLAVMWPEKIKEGRISEDLINLADIAPTILELTNTGTAQMLPMSAKSFTDILFSDRSGIIDSSRDATYAMRERHSSARWMNLGYPQRAVRTHEFLYIRNYYPERWPAGAPQLLDPQNIDELYYMHGLDENGKFTGEAYWDIDEGVSKTYLIENMNDPEVSHYFEIAVEKRPAEELFNIKDDPYSIHNLAEEEGYMEKLEFMRNKLEDFLRKTEDPRAIGPNPDIFENYQRFYTVRPFPKPDWVKP
jgi:uncharacterized sulfatase